MFFHSGSSAPIPELFHSVYLEGPFTHCVDCEVSLLDEGTFYMINKNFVGQEAIFEMAICLNCLQIMQAQYSQETVANIQAFIAQRETEAQALKQLESESDQNKDSEEEPEFTWEDGVRECYLCHRLREHCRRYEIVGIGIEDQLLVAQNLPGLMRTPMMICSDCQESISKLISKKTRDLWDRFMEDHFPGPPGIELESPSFQPLFF